MTCRSNLGAYCVSISIFIPLHKCSEKHDGWRVFVNTLTPEEQKCARRNRWLWTFCPCGAGNSTLKSRTTNTSVSATHNLQYLQQAICCSPDPRRASPLRLNSIFNCSPFLKDINISAHDFSFPSLVAYRTPSSFL